MLQAPFVLPYSSNKPSTMFDTNIRPLIDPALNKIAHGMDRLGLSPNQVTVAGFVVGLGAAALIGLKLFFWAALVLLLSRALDGLDGALARVSGKVSDRGAYLDITLDFIFYSSIPFAFAVAYPEQNALPAAFLIWSFIGTGASFLAYAIMAEKRERKGVALPQQPKSFIFLGGLTEGFETIAFLTLMCLVPSWFGAGAWIFGALAWVTTATRIAMAWRDFSPQNGPDDWNLE